MSDALKAYAEEMNINLGENPFAEEISRCNSPDAVLELLEKNRENFKKFRDKNRKFIDCLNPVVRFVQAFSGVLGEAAGLVSRKYSFRSPFFDSFSSRFRSHPRNWSLSASTPFSLCVLFLGLYRPIM